MILSCDIMVDLETMGVSSNAAIVAIGAVVMDAETASLGATFYATVDLESSMAVGGKVDASTILWWMAQKDTARAEIGKPSMSITQALVAFSDFVRQNSDPRKVRIWGNGARFDNVVLANAYQATGVAQPWNYKNDRCYRTIRMMYPEVEVAEVGTAHHALDDAVYQATVLTKITALLQNRTYTAKE